MPIGANTPIIPVRQFGAPHTTSTGGWPGAISTRATCSLSALGCFLASITRAIVKAASASAGLSTPSTSRPMADSFVVS